MDEKKQKQNNLKVSEEKLLEKEVSLRELQKKLDAKENELIEREEALFSGDKKERPLSHAEKKLIQEGCRTYGINKKYLFHSRIDPLTDDVVLVTHGGKKIRHRPGEPAKFELSEVEITGEVPKEESVWSEKYGQRIGLKSLCK